MDIFKFFIYPFNAFKGKWCNFLFSRIKKHDGGKSIIINFFKSLSKKPSRVSFFIDLKKF